jgi:hypothetical protein
MSGGLPEEYVTDSSGKTVMHPKIDAADFQRHKATLERRLKDPKKVAIALGRSYGARRSVQNMKHPSKLGSGLSHGAMWGMNALFVLPMLTQMLSGGGGMEEAELQELMRGQGGMGSSPQDLQSLLGGLQQQAGGSYADTKEDYYTMRGERAASDMMDVLSNSPSIQGIRPDLQTLIRGYEDQIGRMSSTEPTSLAQAFAMEGIYPSRT